MKTRKLTKRTVDAAAYQGTGRSAFYLWDGETAGFALRIYPSGRKVFVVTYRVRGKQRFYTVGRYGEMTVDEARTEALETLARARKGEDPSGDRQALRHAPTMTELSGRYMKEHSEIKKKPDSIARDRRLWNQHILPRFGHRKVADIERADVAKLHADLAPTPTVGNHVRSVLSKAFNLAEIWGWRREGSNPCRHVPRYKDNLRERFLSDTELARLGTVLSEMETSTGISPYAIAAIRLLILTGCRSAEIVTLRWEHVDFERKCLNLPDSKTGREGPSGLNTAAVEILSQLEPKEGNPYVIPGRRPDKHYQGLGKAWEQIRAEAGMEDLRIHDLRHTFASVGINSGQALPLIGKLLGHSKVATTERYAHLADQSVRQAGEEIGERISAALNSQAA